jgi:DNA-binding XRE family transcriptional regulator
MISFDVHGFAQEVKKTRETMNLSQAAFGKLVGVSKATIERVEHAQSTPFWVGVLISYICSINVHQYVLHHER